YACTRGGGSAAGAGLCALVQRRRPEPAELSRAHRGDSVARAIRDEIYTQLRQGAAIYFCEFHLQQHFLCALGPESQHIDYLWRICTRQLSGSFRNIFGGNVPGENNRRSGGSHADLLIRENSLFLLGARADIHIYSQVEAARALVFIPDQQRNLARR